MTDEEIKEYHIKKLYLISINSRLHKPKLEKPTWEQEQWVDTRLSAPEWTWNRGVRMIVVRHLWDLFWSTDNSFQESDYSERLL